MKKRKSRNRDETTEISKTNEASIKFKEEDCDCSKVAIKQEIDDPDYDIIQTNDKEDITSIKFPPIKKERPVGKLRIQKIIKQEPSDEQNNTSQTGTEGDRFTGRPVFLQIQTQKLGTKPIRVGKKFTCDICLKGVGTRGGLMYHMKEHLFGRPFKCEICKKSYATKNDFNTHNKRHAGKKFTCNFCNKNFTVKQYLADHIEFVHLPKTLQCLFCKYKNLFSSEETLNHHLHMCHPHAAFNKPVETYKCYLCNYSSKSKTSLKIHVAHAVKMRLQCKNCLQKFSCRNLLAKHTKWEQTTLKMCEICKAPKKNYYQHMKNYHKLVKCDLCLFTTTRALELSDHKKKCGTQSQIRTLGLHCVDCNLYFRTRHILLQHQNKKHGQYKCTQCPATFFHKASKSSHKRQHKKPIFRFRCLICPKKIFTDKERFDAHFRCNHFSVPQCPRSLYACHWCVYRSFCRKNRLRSHIFDCHKEQLLGIPYTPQPRKIFKCHWCPNRIYFSKNGLRKHIYDLHKEQLGIHNYKMRLRNRK